MTGNNAPTCTNLRKDPTRGTIISNERNPLMAAKTTNEFAKRAESLLGRRVETVQRLGELIETKTKQQAELAVTDDRIAEAVAECTAAGWSQAELTELGAPRPKGKRKAKGTGGKALDAANTAPNQPGDQPATPAEGAHPQG